jgi:hypothetical protein
VTHRAGLRRSYRFLFGIEFVISWMTRLYIPIVATAFLAGIIALYVLLSLAAALCGKVSVDLPLGRLDARASRRESRHVPPKEGENRNEFSLGACAHVHYWDWRNLEVAKELDSLIMALKSTPPAQPPLSKEVIIAT